MLIRNSNRILIWLLFFAAMHCAGLKPNPKFNESSSPDDDTNESENHLLHNAGYSSAFENRLMQAIESYLGVPYRWGGSTKSGMDCSGFVRTVYRGATGLELPHSARTMFKMGKFIEETELKFGDLVFFENIENYGVSHVGIYLGSNKFAHTSTTQGVTISYLNEKYYRQRFIGARKILKKK
ncbi:MAG: C40 family peptidase [bacterium]